VIATVPPIWDQRMMKPCAFCDRDFLPASRSSRFCSESCATSARWATVPRRQSRPWSEKTAAIRAAYDSAAYRRARTAVVAAAIGSPCPGCGVLLTAANCQADHVIPRAMGGPSSPSNLRPLCSSCNLRRGSQLGGRVTSARRAARKRLM
jgi:5-methylcytosine-specific restriction endonuclease McrA